MNGFLRKLTSKEGENQNKKKIENLVFLIIILIVTIIIINAIWKKDENSNNTTKDTNSLSGKILADNSKNEVSNQTELETKLENILSTIKNVGKVNVLINYSESSSLVPLYNESTTTSSTEEGDSGGGTRNVTETESKKDVVFSESSGQKQYYGNKGYSSDLFLCHGELHGSQ